MKSYIQSRFIRIIFVYITFNLAFLIFFIIAGLPSSIHVYNSLIGYKPLGEKGFLNLPVSDVYVDFNYADYDRDFFDYPLYKIQNRYFFKMDVEIIPEPLVELNMELSWLVNISNSSPQVSLDSIFYIGKAYNKYIIIRVDPNSNKYHTTFFGVFRPLTNEIKEYLQNDDNIKNHQIDVNRYYFDTKVKETLDEQSAINLFYISLILFLIMFITTLFVFINPKKRPIFHSRIFYNTSKIELLNKIQSEIEELNVPLGKILKARRFKTKSFEFSSTLLDVNIYPR